MEVKYNGEEFIVVKPEKDYTWLKPKTDEGFTKGDIVVIPTKTLNENENVQSVTIGVKIQREQLICVYCGINPIGGNCPYPKKCSTKKKIKAN